MERKEKRDNGDKLLEDRNIWGKKNDGHSKEVRAECRDGEQSNIYIEPQMCLNFVTK